MWLYPQGCLTPTETGYLDKKQMIISDKILNNGKRGDLKMTLKI